MPTAKQAVKAECDVSESTIVLHGAGGAQRKSFTVHIPALGIKEITFYLDGRKVKSLTSADAKKGEFSVTINSAKLSYGAHKISVKTVMDDSACAAIARTAGVRAPAAGEGAAEVHRLRETSCDKARRRGAREGAPGAGQAHGPRLTVATGRRTRTEARASDTRPQAPGRADGPRPGADVVVGPPAGQHHAGAPATRAGRPRRRFQARREERGRLRASARTATGRAATRARVCSPTLSVE